MKFTKIITTVFAIGIFFVLTSSNANAQIPDIEGYVLVGGTNAPVPTFITTF